MRGTTSSTAGHMVATSRRSRPATGGNKNTNARASRKPAPMPTSRTNPIKGPDRGTG